MRRLELLFPLQLLQISLMLCTPPTICLTGYPLPVVYPSIVQREKSPALQPLAVLIQLL